MKEEMYKNFRNDLDKYAIPLILDNLAYTEIKFCDKVVGFICMDEDYLDAFYILPKYRRKGIGSASVQELYKMFKFKRLHIINNNIPALNFWNKNFKLKVIESNFCDTLYEIIDLKGGEENGRNNN